MSRDDAHIGHARAPGKSIRRTCAPAGASSISIPPVRCAVNSIGFEVGDWGTCCQPSALYISFDDGAPIQMGISRTYGDAFLTNNGAGVFVAALVNKGTLPPQGVPEPAPRAMFIAGFGVVGGTMRRRSTRPTFA